MTFGAFLAQAWTMRNKPFALVAALAAAFALPLSPARAQYIVADIPADEETAVFDPDLRDVGVRLEKRYKQQIESVESSFALVILEEFEIIPGDRQVMEAVPVEPQSTTRLVAYVCLLPEEDDYLSAKGLYYCEIYSGKDSRPFLDEGAFPVSANRENDSFVWEAYLYDSEIQYHWANSKSSISNYSHLGDDLGQGLPGAPYKTESSKKTIFQSFIFYPYRIPCFMSFLRIYEKFLDFAKKGKSDANHSIEYQRDADDIEKVQLIYDKVHGESAPYGGMAATSFLWEAATKSGLLTKYDQTNMHNDGGSASMAHRWKIEQLEKHAEL